MIDYTLHALQWGQRHSALETVAPQRITRRRAILQWDQRHSALETNNGQRDHHSRIATSMGPTPFSVGDADMACAFAAKIRDFNGANAIQGWRHGCFGLVGNAPSYFNGANAIQGWRRSCSTSERPELWALQWGQRHSGLETAFSPRFWLSLALPMRRAPHLGRRDGARLRIRAAALSWRAGFGGIFCERPIPGGVSAGALALGFGRFRGFSTTGFGGSLAYIRLSRSGARRVWAGRAALQG